MIVGAGASEYSFLCITLITRYLATAKYNLYRFVYVYSRTVCYKSDNGQDSGIRFGRGICPRSCAAMCVRGEYSL